MLFAGVLGIVSTMEAQTVFIPDTNFRVVLHAYRPAYIDTLTGLNDYAAKAQDYLANLGERYQKLAERMKYPDSVKLAWLVG